MRIKLLTFNFLFLTLIFAPPVYAAKSIVYFHLPQESVAPGSEFALTVFLDSDSEINALQMAVEFTPETLEFLGYSNADSVVDIWQKNPSLVSGNLVEFSGGLTQPFNGIAGEVIRLNFRAKFYGIGGFALKSSDLYLADGSGSKIQTSPFYLRLTVESGARQTELPSVSDPTPPQITLIPSESLSDGGKILVVQVKDGESGSGQISTRTFEDWRWSEWSEVSNPVQLPQTAWLLEVKALNGAGQARSVLVWGRNLKLIISSLGTGLALLALYFCYNIYKARKKRV